MVAARPTSRWDLDRMRMHSWNATTTCHACGLEITADLVLADLPGCPGPLFRLTFLGQPKHRGLPATDESSVHRVAPRHVETRAHRVDAVASIIAALWPHRMSRKAAEQILAYLEGR